MMVTETRDLSYSQLDEANSSIASENYVRAFNQLSSAYNLALSIDNTELLCKISLSGIILKINCPNLSEAVPALDFENASESKSFLSGTKEEILEYAKKFASRSDEKSRAILSDLCVIYEVCVNLENEKISLAAGESKISAQNAKKYVSMLENIKSSVSKEPYYEAFSERTMGEVCMAGGDFESARMHYEEAAKIHTKNRYLPEISLDWYCAARASSQNNDKSAAVTAIKMALKYDKDAENTRGIASDYLAWSKILLKGNPTEEEIRLSEELAEWSKKITDIPKL